MRLTPSWLLVASLLLGSYVEGNKKGLIGFWRLNADTGGKDASKLKNDGALGKKVKYLSSPNGAPGGSMHFDGNLDAFVKIPKSKKIELDGSFSVTFHIRSALKKPFPIMEWQGGSHIWHYPKKGDLYLCVYGRKTGKPVTASKNVLKADKWNKVGIVYDRKKNKIIFFVNGVKHEPKPSGTIAQMYPKTNGNLLIGQRPGDAVHTLHGDLSCVRLFNEALDHKGIKKSLKECGF